MTDFWRMVWENDVPVIVMITNLVEMGRPKCEKYWPDLGEKVECGDVVVRALNQVPGRHFNTTTLELRDEQLGVTKTCTHLWCISWPDHGVPEDTASVVAMIDAVHDLQAAQSRRLPSVVHCSAGIGRSGVFIALDVLMRQVRGCDPINRLCITREDGQLHVACITSDRNRLSSTSLPMASPTPTF